MVPAYLTFAEPVIGATFLLLGPFTGEPALREMVS